ncbi:MAG: hypothetical protein MJ154_02140 [Candidatus Saccharibacteria bacterium]|nr:hypothetical protein [Candidatus Saccharibacteria bacterium]
MNSKPQVQQIKISKRVKLAIIACITIMSVVIFAAIALYCSNYYPDTISEGVEFTMRVGDRRAVRGTDNLVIELANIEDGRCSSIDNPSVVCFWEGEISYTFRVDNEEFTLGTVTDASDGEKIKDFAIKYISGDEKSGVFVLQKSEK